jgi:hypothetical protein
MASGLIHTSLYLPPLKKQADSASYNRQRKDFGRRQIAVAKRPTRAEDGVASCAPMPEFSEILFLRQVSISTFLFQLKQKMAVIARSIARKTATPHFQRPPAP